MSTTLPILAQLEFPPIENLVEWPNIVGGEDVWWGFNKIALYNVVAVVVTTVLFLLAGAKKAMVPRGVQNLMEVSVDFIDKGIVQQTIGHGGEKYIPFLGSLFFFILIGNMFEVIPPFLMPANARMANPAILALLTWAFFICVGVKAQGPKYFFNAVFPPGVPKALYLLVTPIEFVSVFLVRPFSLAVRLFANMLAGHILLVTFAVLSAAMWSLGPSLIVLPLPAAVLVLLTGFEVMVAFLQAYIFTILTAVYIGGAMHPEH